MRVVWDGDLASYDFGPNHPLAPLRVELTMALADALGVLGLPNVEVVPAPVADDALLELVHAPAYVAAVRACSAGGDADPEFCIGTRDTPSFVGMHEAAAHVVGATVEAARSVWSGEVAHAVSPAGGLHHAMPGRASGFCVYNDISVAIAWLLENGAERVAYVDVDVHHGDGVERAFLDDPRVLTISLHETGDELFPGTGFVGDCGSHSDGTVVNVPLPARTGDDAWLRAFDAVVPELLEAFAPDVLVTQQGCDTHSSDPLAHFALTLDCLRETYARLHVLAHEHAGGRWVALGGGGYSIVKAVPRAWTHLIAEVADHPIAPDTETPQVWRDLVLERTGRDAPLTMTDGGQPALGRWADGSDPADPLDRMLLDVRAACFPQHGLQP
jgi:acetoin utilization protein AcuC